ncbi:MAG: hypothetical protein LBT95_10240 [Treponema sp.]|jgi:hypothetical protein|nr:hypothetical protein [Treponema sp.]
MAIIDINTGIIRGKLGSIVFEYRMGTNYARKYVKKKSPPSAKQKAHQKLYAQLQGLGSIWLNGLIKPYFVGDQTQQCAYREFIKYNWPRWDKIVPAWTVALPFWGYGNPPVVATDAVSVPGNVVVDLFPPPPLALSACTPHFFQILKENLNWKSIPGYVTLPDRFRVILPGSDGYNSGDWNMLAWLSGQPGGVPVTDPVRG